MVAQDIKVHPGGQAPPEQRAFLDREAGGAQAHRWTLKPGNRVPIDQGVPVYEGSTQHLSPEHCTPSLGLNITQEDQN